MERERERERKKKKKKKAAARLNVGAQDGLEGSGSDGLFPLAHGHTCEDMSMKNMSKRGYVNR